MRGGLDTAKREGVHAELWRAMAGKKDAKRFVHDFRMGETKDFTIKKYGDDEANTLARAWVHRVAHFHDQWVAMGRPRPCDWGPVVAAYVEPEWLARLEREAGGDDIAEGLRRARRVVPRN